MRTPNDRNTERLRWYATLRKHPQKVFLELEIRCSIRLSYGRSCAEKLPPATVTCNFSRAACDEIDHVCNRTCRDWAGRCLCLAHGKSKRKRCNELANGDCALQVRRLVGVR